MKVWKHAIPPYGAEMNLPGLEMICIWERNIKYAVSKKKLYHYVFSSNFAKCWLIVKDTSKFLTKLVTDLIHVSTLPCEKNYSVNLLTARHKMCWSHVNLLHEQSRKVETCAGFQKFLLGVKGRGLEMELGSPEWGTLQRPNRRSGDSGIFRILWRASTKGGLRHYGGILDSKWAIFCSSAKCPLNTLLLGDLVPQKLKHFDICETLVCMYTVSQKKLCHFYFYCNFGKCWSIFKILSLSESERNVS